MKGPLASRAARVLSGLLAALVLSSAGAAPQKVVRVGLLDIEREVTYAEPENIQRSTLAYLRRALPELKIEAKILTIPDLALAIRRGEVDLFLSSSGFFVEMWPAGVKDLATLVSKDFPDPNHCVAGTFFVRADRPHADDVEDLKGLRLVTTNPSNFMAFQIGLSEVARLGFDPDTFFSSVQYTKNDLPEVLRRVADGRADVGVVRSCVLEALGAKHAEFKNAFRVVNAVGGHDRCVYSTELYPGWVIAATQRTDPELAEKIVRALLEKPPTQSAGYRWSVATDYKSVLQVFERLKIGPYAHLRHLTIRSLLERYWPILAMLLVGGAAWILHWLSVERLVRRRTAELDQALQAQVKLKEQAIASGREVEHLTKLGIVNELSCIYAHEMAQPLTSIGYLAKTLDLLAGKDAPDKELLRRCVGKIQTDLRSAESILGRVRQYAKSAPSRSKPVDLAELLPQVVRSIRNIAPDVEIAFHADPAAVVSGDPLELRILVLNLLRNAVRECLPLPGEATSAVQVFLKASDGAAMLEVRNRARRPRVESVGGRLRFTGDERVLTDSERESRGLGLGLLIVQTVTKAHRGSFEYVYDEARMEAVFRVRLALAEYSGH